MDFIADSSKWAEQIFGKVQLGNQLRTNRLVKTASYLAQSPGESLNRASMGNQAAAEGATRLMRNKHITAQQIAEGGFDTTVGLMKEGVTYLALEDTTTLLYKHSSVSNELGFINTPSDRSRGWLVHSVLLVEESLGDVIGLLEQERWMREQTKSEKPKKRSYKEKESYKWESSSKRMGERLLEKKKDVISVCDREADIHEYLQYKVDEGERFVVRSRFDRQVKGEFGQVKGELGSKPVSAGIKIEIGQRESRAARTVDAEMRFGKFVFKDGYKREQKSFSMGVVWVKEIGEDKQGTLEWLLFTSEKLENGKDALRVVEIYRKRWLIEEFHKAWKSGCKVEERRQQAALNLEKIGLILGFVAVRLLQLRSVNRSHPETPCDCLLSEIQWKVLWKRRHENKPIPKEIPTIKWAMETMARLAGWTDTQRTGRIGWETLWKGWMELDFYVKGVELAKALSKPD